MHLHERLDRFFGITERGSDVRTELYGAFVLFLSMSYILVVNPQMMADAGLDRGASFTATVVVTAVACLVMGIYARMPFAQAPAMGILAFFVYTVVLGMDYSWDAALLAAFLSGLIFMAISVSRVRKVFVEAIPAGLRAAMSAGIGAFIVFIGLKNAGLIVADPATCVALGDLSDPGVLLALFCIAATVLMVVRGIRMAVFFGMVLTAAIGLAMGIIPMPESLVSCPVAFEVGGLFGSVDPSVFDVDFVMVVVSFVFVMFFDSTGTLVALSRGEEGNDLDRAFVADAAAATVSPLMGCIPCNAYVESAVGIEAGSRTGLTAVFVALFFLMALFLGPLFMVVDYRCTVAALFMVGVSMFSSLRHVEWSDKVMTVTVLMTVLMTVLTYSITYGMSFGVITYSLGMIGSGRKGEVHPVVYGVALLAAVYLILSAVQF